MKSRFADYDEGADAAEVVEAPCIPLKIKPAKRCQICGLSIPDNHWYCIECQRERRYAVGTRVEGRGKGKRGPDKGPRKPYKKRVSNES